MFDHLCIPTSLGTTRIDDLEWIHVNFSDWLSFFFFCSVAVEEVPFPGVVPCSFFFLPPSPCSFVLIRHKSFQREIKTKRCLIIHLFFQICFYVGQCFPGVGLGCCWDGYFTRMIIWHKISQLFILMGKVPNGGATTQVKQQLFTHITV